VDEAMNDVERDLAVGDLYEDCAYHPVLCTYVSYEDDEIAGISLVDGSAPRGCSLRHCGVRKLDMEEALRLRSDRPRELPLPRSHVDSAVPPNGRG
jgi:hypothetical protein